MESPRAKTPPSVETLPGLAMKPERNAGLIMGACLFLWGIRGRMLTCMQTNNSSIVSKRSVERLYLPEPHMYRHFVKKPQRRSPTINRGYWLRMKAIEHVVKEFLERPAQQQKLVVNLGCG